MTPEARKRLEENMDRNFSNMEDGIWRNQVKRLGFDRALDEHGSYWERVYAIRRASRQGGAS